MILRKPYAFFIKMFKPIHLVIGLLIGLLISTEGRIYSFLHQNSTRSLNLIGQNLKSEYINTSLFIIPIVLILLFMGILVIMFYKKKPYIFYLVSIGSVLGILIINIYTLNFFKELNEAIVSVKYVKLTHDLVLISLIIEVVLLVLVLIRGAGVNIQKFNFDSDISKIDIKDTDNEEFEVNISFDIDRTKRERNKRIRYLKYAYEEKKLVVNIVAIAIIFVIAITSIVLFNNRTKIYNEKKNVRTRTCSIIVDNSYAVNKSYDGNQITDKYLIVVDARVRLNYDQAKAYLNDFNIKIGNNTYTATTMYNKYLIDLGNGFLSDSLTTEFANYIFVYEVPEKVISKKILFTYNDGRKLNYIRLKPKKVDSNDEVVINLGEQVEFEGKLKGVSLKIDSYDIQDRYALQYDFCISAKDCIKSVEYIKAKINKDYDKAVIKLELDYKNESELNLKTFYNLLSTFGHIEYVIDNNVKKLSDIEDVVSYKASKKGVVYLGVNREIIEATEVNFVFNIRGKKYIYRVK